MMLMRFALVLLSFEASATTHDALREHISRAMVHALKPAPSYGEAVRPLVMSLYELDLALQKVDPAQRDLVGREILERAWAGAKISLPTLGGMMGFDKYWLRRRLLREAGFGEETQAWSISNDRLRRYTTWVLLAFVGTVVVTTVGTYSLHASGLDDWVKIAGYAGPAAMFVESALLTRALIRVRRQRERVGQILRGCERAMITTRR